MNFCHFPKHSKCLSKNNTKWEFECCTRAEFEIFLLRAWKVPLSGKINMFKKCVLKFRNLLCSYSSSWFPYLWCCSKTTLTYSHKITCQSPVFDLYKFFTAILLIMRWICNFCDGKIFNFEFKISPIIYIDQFTRTFYLNYKNSQNHFVLKFNFFLSLTTHFTTLKISSNIVLMSPDDESY